MGWPLSIYFGTGWLNVDVEPVIIGSDMIILDGAVVAFMLCVFVYLSDASAVHDCLSNNALNIFSANFSCYVCDLVA